MYRLDFTADAERDLDRLDLPIRTRILKRLAWLADNAENVQHEFLGGLLSDLRKFRVGDYRILYDLIQTEQLILVHQIDHRSQIYRAK
ncbi:MAG: type II toxin-antitoxin system RelE/ParE family toxin [Anaerolineales bacterium]|nr:type II toxin-antitoxin system RelE/ParE family toxin [Anaerolineales bacterium]